MINLHQGLPLDLLGILAAHDCKYCLFWFIIVNLKIKILDNLFIQLQIIQFPLIFMLEILIGKKNS